LPRIGKHHHDYISHDRLLIGAIAGWLASLIVRGHGLGLAGNLAVGIVGAVIAGWLLPMIGFVFVGGILAAIINAVIGAVILLAIIGFVQQKMASVPRSKDIQINEHMQGRSARPCSNPAAPAMRRAEDGDRSRTASRDQTQRLVLGVTDEEEVGVANESFGRRLFAHG
jgi:uncharacterized membrane protein YeaQ/YmgE (transglycosylase-associated protein family)